MSGCAGLSFFIERKPMPRVQKYRRKFDGVILDAYQYGEGKEWTPEATTRVAAFVTGIDINKTTTIETERVMDVVTPILTEWDHRTGKTPINVSHKSGIIRLDLGDWVVRNPDGRLEFVKQDTFDDQYELLREINGRYLSLVEIETDKLSDFIYDECMSTLDGELYQTLAENIAGKLIRAGWRKEGP
jgi:hypothetical protein